MKIRFSTLLTACLMVLLTLSISLSAQDVSPSNKVALAISGGASKGAYEAGLIWGLVEATRKVEQTGDWSLGGEALPIKITSIAGTSAGGINALLAALVWSVNLEKEGGFTNRIDDNIFRDVWLPLGVTVTRVRPDIMVVSGVEVHNQRFSYHSSSRSRRTAGLSFFSTPATTRP